MEHDIPRVPRTSFSKELWEGAVVLPHGCKEESLGNDGFPHGHILFPRGAALVLGLVGNQLRIGVRALGLGMWMDQCVSGSMSS